MIKVLNAKALTKNPSDSVGTLTLALFGRMSDEKVRFYSEMEDGLEEKGALRRIMGSRMQFLRRERPDYLWGFGGVRDLALILMRPKGTKYIINWHAMLIKRTNATRRVRTPWFVRSFIFNRAEMIICSSAFSAETVRGFFPHKKVVVLAQGVDIDMFHPSKRNDALLAQKYNIDATKPLVVFVGALQSRKRPEIFIELAARCPDAQFIVVGRPDPAHEVLSKTTGLKNFQWIERMPREDVAVLFASSKLFVFPSLDEPSALVILEAMASGCIPILSRSGGNVDFVKDGESGFLVSPDNNEVDTFLKTIHNLLADRMLRENASRAARERAERHSWDRVAEEYEEKALFI